MEYFDLDMLPGVANNGDIAVIVTLIDNSLQQYHNQEYFDNFKISYNSKTKTLTFKDDGTGIKLADFVEKLSSKQPWFTTGLRNSISDLMARKISITFKNQFGTFTPILEDKEGIKEKIPSILIAHEEVSSNDKEESLVGTTTTICKLDSKTMTNLKYHLSFMHKWKKIIKTEYGMILINDEQPKDLFLKGENITQFKYCPDENINFTFSYDVNEDAFDPRLFANKYQPSNYALECIDEILAHLNDEDKYFVYSKIFNNEDAGELNNEVIKAMLTDYFNELTPNKYLIAMFYESCDSMYSTIAKLCNKEVIWFESQENYDELVKAGITSLRQFAYDYVKEHFTNFVNPSQLNSQAKSNWKLINDLLTFMVNHVKEIHNRMQKLKLTHFDFKIVKGLPDAQPLYFVKNNLFLIDESRITNYKDLIEDVYDLVTTALKSVGDEDLKYVWIGALMYFLFYSQSKNKLN